MPTKAQLQEQLKREREISKEILSELKKVKIKAANIMFDIIELRNAKKSLTSCENANRELRFKYEGLLHAFRIVTKTEKDEF